MDQSAKLGVGLGLGREKCVSSENAVVARYDDSLLAGCVEDCGHWQPAEVIAVVMAEAVDVAQIDRCCEARQLVAVVSDRCWLRAGNERRAMGDA